MNAVGMMPWVESLELSREQRPRAVRDAKAEYQRARCVLRWIINDLTLQGTAQYLPPLNDLTL